jgi:hypothetical protein
MAARALARLDRTGKGRQSCRIWADGCVKRTAERAGFASALPLGRWDLGVVLFLNGGQLGKETIRRRIGHGGRMRLGYGPGVGEPEAEMFQDPPDDQRVLDKRDNAHFGGAFGADQGIDFVNFLDQPGPIFSKLLRGDLRLQHSWDRVYPFSEGWDWGWVRDEGAERVPQRRKQCGKGYMRRGGS